VNKDLLKKLELDPSGTYSKEDIKKQYKKLAAKYHPDVNKSENANVVFSQITDAYKALTTETKKTYRNISPTHIHITLPISFKESVLSCKKDVTFNRMMKCNSCMGHGATPKNNGCTACNGFGKVIQSNQNITSFYTCLRCHGKVDTEFCNTCSGEGIVNVTSTINVTIPSGVTSDTTLRLQGIGNYMPLVNSMFLSDIHTDVLIKLDVEKHHTLSLENNVVVYNLKISLLEALKGCKKTVPTLDNDMEIEIPALTKNMDVIKLNEHKYNHVNVVTVEYPNDTSDLIAALEKK
jgi:molecular chaperone DnaJ